MILHTDADTIVVLILLFLGSAFMAWLITWAIFSGQLRITKAREQLESLSSGGTDGQAMDATSSEGKDRGTGKKVSKLL